MSGPRISVVVPVYGCADCLRQLCERLDTILSSFASWFEILLVDDRSPDNSWAQFAALKAKHPRVRGLRLSRNFGQHIAITAGLATAQGDVVVVMDCDLQDPPEHIPALWEKMQQGNEIVLARRLERSHSGFRVAAAKLYFRLLSRMTEEKVEGSYGTFSMLSRKAVDAFLRFGERDRHYLFIVRWLGFATDEIEYRHAERAAGCSSYSLRRLIRHALEGLFFQSTVLLRWIVGLGLGFALVAMGFGIYLILRYYMNAGAVAGWTSLAVLILFCTGTLLTCMGVIGLYIGKMFDQGKGRPLYIIDIDTGEVA